MADNPEGGAARTKATHKPLSEGATKKKPKAEDKAPAQGAPKLIGATRMRSHDAGNGTSVPSCIIEADVEAGDLMRIACVDVVHVGAPTELIDMGGGRKKAIFGDGLKPE